MHVPGLAEVLSAEGWPYASTAPTSASDPGWFHALFCRDALITSLQVLPARPDVARATLRALADRQGSQRDPATLEEPGKIGHEFRDRPPQNFVDNGWPSPGPFRYYGSADSTAWFLVVLAALHDAELSDVLAGHRRAAAGWLRDAVERGGGLVRHAPGTAPGGLTQQGWRDARDPTSAKGTGVLCDDGSPPEPPLADAETQAITYVALRTLADGAGPGDSRRADRFRDAVTELFLPDVLMLQAGDRPIHAAGSQLGWLLWAGAIDPARAHPTAMRLVEPDILTPFGLRTLSADHPGFRPTAYHRGSVWPFDTWIGWGGLRAAGFTAQAETLRRGVIRAVDRLGGYPELYAVDRGGRLHGVAVGTHHQAWTVGARWALEQRWDGRFWDLSARRTADHDR